MFQKGNLKTFAYKGNRTWFWYMLGFNKLLNWSKARILKHENSFRR